MGGARQHDTELASSASDPARRDPKGVFEPLLEWILATSGAKGAFIGEYMSDENRTFIMRASLRDDHSPIAIRATCSLFNELAKGTTAIANDRETIARLLASPPDVESLLALPFIDANGAVHGVLGVVDRPGGFGGRDVERLQPLATTCAALIHARSAVVQAQSAWRETFDSVELPLVSLDERARVVRLNRAARDLLGRTYAQTIGRALADLADSEPWTTSSQIVKRAVRERAGVEAEARDPKDGRVWEITASPTDAAGARALLVVRDVTQTVELQRSLRRVETVAALGRIMAGVAHEVRNPLFGVGATLDAFEARFGASPEHAPFFIVLRKELKRLATLMEDLLEYGRPASLNPAPTDLVHLVKNAISHCESERAKRNIVLDYEPPDGPLELRVDAARITQIFINLVENAIQHSPTGGRVRLRHASEVDASGTRWAAILVEDEGSGFVAEELPRVFEPFFTKRPGGTGLGLSIVQRIVELHAGRVDAENVAGGGAKITVLLPS
jgi:PAS domain S-box-containing protein